MNQDEQKPTPGDGGASTQDPLTRLETMLSAGSQSEETPRGEAADESVEPGEGAPDEETQPQLSTADLAKMLGADESILDVDEDGTPKFKLKIDGKEVAPKLAELIRSYQTQGHVDNESRKIAEQAKALQEREKQAEQQFKERIEYAENLTSVAANQLLQEYQSVDWKTLEAQDPGTAALWRQKFQEKQAQLRGVYENIQREKGQAEQKSQAAMQDALQREAQRLPELIPEWKDSQVAMKERAELREWAIKAGYEPAEIDSISKAHHVAVLRKAMMADKLQASKPAIEAKVRAAPKLVKPGQAAVNSKEDQLRSLHTAVRKSGGKNGTIEQFLLASGKV